ncbi:hypothetical protein HDU98_005756 [Podochytrium sp. JEL0797]|nr:hypothetical protein HDU98_005756 [Podochytrium sp. JEL0797]
MSDTSTSAPLLLLSKSECNNFATACEAAAPSKCNGSFAYACYPGTTDASLEGALNYPAGICARCLCNGKTPILADMSCIDTPAPDATGGGVIQGGGSGATSPVSGSPAVMPMPTASASPLGGPGSTSNVTIPPPGNQAAPYALPLYLSLSLVAAVCAGVAVFFYMKRKPREKDNEDKDPINPTLGRKNQFLQSIWTTTTTTTTSNDSTTTVTVVYPPGAPPPPTSTTSDPSTNEKTTTTTLIHTPYLPSDSFLTPSSSSASPPANQQWTLEEQWRHEQYQAAVQWHQWQLKQKEWQAEQRAYYLAKEAERKLQAAQSPPVSASTLTPTTHASDDSVSSETNPHPPLPTTTSDPSPPPRGRKPIGLLGAEGYRPSPLRFQSTLAPDNESILSKRSRVSSMFDSGSLLIQELKQSISRSSTVHSRNDSLRSCEGRSSLIVATSPEWSAPTDLVRVGSVSTGGGSTYTRRASVRSKMDSLRKGSGGESDLTITSTTFALGEDVSVVTMQSIGQDGVAVTSQILQSVNSAASGTLSPRMLSPSLYSGSFDAHDANAPAPAYEAVGSPFHPTTSRICEEPESSSDATLQDDTLLEDDLQMKYTVKHAHIPALEDELALEEGDEVVVWHILEDGNCEGYCVGKKESGYFPVKSVLG